MKGYILYVLRWVVLALPGAMFLVQVQHVINNTYLAMAVSQGILGMLVYFIDRKIMSIGGKKGRREKRKKHQNLTLKKPFESI